jgi:hypothetical protein
MRPVFFDLSFGGMIAVGVAIVIALVFAVILLWRR